MRLLLALAFALVAGFAAAQEPLAVPEASSPSVEIVAPPPPVCGTQPITIARMQWPSASLLAEIHARILKQVYNCQVEIVPGDLAATGASMAAAGQPAVAPELWLARIPEVWNPAINAQKVRQASVTFAEPVLEGWYIPDYVAATTPALTSAASLQALWPALANGAPKARFISCPIDWACSVINRNLLRANGLEPYFDVVEPANRFELDTLIAEAVGRKEPILFYYWAPNSVLSQFSFKPIDLGAYNKDAFLCLGRRTCATPAPSGFAPEPVVIAVAEWVFLDVPEIATYFTRAKLPVAEMNAMLAQLSEQGTTVETVADRFVAEKEAIWRPWVGTLTTTIGQPQ